MKGTTERVARPEGTKVGLRDQIAALTEALPAGFISALEPLAES
jgi:hypothetical protein